jgi:hypothetical protein
VRIAVPRSFGRRWYNCDTETHALRKRRAAALIEIYVDHKNRVLNGTI